MRGAMPVETGVPDALGDGGLIGANDEEVAGEEDTLIPIGTAVGTMRTETHEAMSFATDRDPSPIDDPPAPGPWRSQHAELQRHGVRA